MLKIKKKDVEILSIWWPMGRNRRINNYTTKKIALFFRLVVNEMKKSQIHSVNESSRSLFCIPSQFFFIAHCILAQ